MIKRIPYIHVSERLINSSDNIQKHMGSDILTKDQMQRTHSTEWITISLDEYESITHSLEILSDSDLMDQINEIKEQDEGKDFEELAEELGI